MSAPKTLVGFLEVVGKLIPQDSILYLEGGGPRNKLKLFLEEHSVPEISHVAIGTIWPKPKIFHLPATPENLSMFKELSEGYAEPEILCHLHVYKDNKVLVQWYDAFSEDPMYISKEIPENKLKEFCDILSIEYEVYP